MKLVKETSVNGVLRIILVGEFDSLGAKLVRGEFEGIAKTDDFNKIDIDIRGVDFIDSSGVGAIVFLYKRLIEKGAGMSLVGVKGQPAELLKLLRINEAIDVEFIQDDANQNYAMAGNS